MKYIAISDTHGCHRQLNLPQGDVLLHAGDVCNQGNREEVADFLKWMSELDFEHKILIRGNHDFNLEKKTSLLDIEMPQGVLQLDHSGIEINKLILLLGQQKHTHTSIRFKNGRSRRSHVPLFTRRQEVK